MVTIDPRGLNSMGDGYKDLEPAVRLRIRRVVTTSAVWAGLLVVSTAVFLVSKPYLDKRREERSKQPGYQPLVTRKDLPSPSQSKNTVHYDNYNYVSE